MRPRHKAAENTSDVDGVPDGEIGFNEAAA